MIGEEEREVGREREAKMKESGGEEEGEYRWRGERREG